MVSLKKKFGVYFFVSALVLVCLLMPAELQASQQCCKNGKLTTCPNLPNGQQYDLSGCQGGISPVDPVVPVNPGLEPVNPGLEIEIGGEVFLDECTSGQAQYKPSGDCGTSKRTCCSSGSWSGWDESCPTTKDCPTSSKPSTKESCYGGYRYRSVTCNKSTGTWTKGEWGKCDCSDSAFESVPTLGGDTCCQRKDGTGVRCATDATSGTSWRLFCNNCCNGGSDTAVSSLSACGTCTESMANQYPSYQCCVKSSGSGVGLGSSTTINGYVCGY